VARPVLILEVALSLVYPFAIHLAVSWGRPRLAAVAVLVTCGVLIVLGWFRRGSRRLVGLRLGTFVVVAVFAWLAVRLDRSVLLLLYPLFVNLGLCLAFAASLLRKRSLIETFARLHRPELAPEEVSHCRAATWVWSAYFLVNAAVVGGLAFFAPLALWTLYTGVVSYVLSALVGLAELVVRVRRFGPGSAGLLGKRLLPLLAPLLRQAPGRFGGN
jgi:uncharacterized membrane protein